MLRAFLAPGPSDVVADLGCGSGRAPVWNRDWRASAVGIDITPFFADEARRDVDLPLGTFVACRSQTARHESVFARRARALVAGRAARGPAEAARVLAPGGGLFVYTHVGKNAPMAVGFAGSTPPREASNGG